MPTALDAQRLQLMDQQTLEAGKNAQALDLENQKQQRELDADRAQAIAIQQQIQAHVQNNTQVVPISPAQLQPPKIQDPQTGEWQDNPNAGKPMPPGAEPSGIPAGQQPNAGTGAAQPNPNAGDVSGSLSGSGPSVGPPNSPAATPPFLPQQQQASQVHVPYVDLNQLAVDMAKQGFGNHAVALMQTAQNLQSKSLENAKNQILLEEANQKRLGEATGGLMQLYNSGPQGQQQAQQEWQTLGPQLARQGLVDSQTAVAPFNPSWADAQYRRAVGLTGVMAQMKEAAGIKETESEPGEHQALATEAGARAGLYQEQTLEAKQSRIAMENFVKDPGAVMGKGGTIDQEVPPDQYPDLNQRTHARVYAIYTGPGTVQQKVTQAQQAMQQATQEIDRIEEETNPKVIQSRVSQAVQTEVGKQKALVATSPDAFAGILDPKVRAQAQVTYQKASDDYADKVSASQQLQDFVAAAQSGNKAAPGLIPITEVRQLVNRVNRQELESVSASAGSALDRVQGKLNSLTEGQPIPPAVLKDIATISNTMANAARRGYEYRVQILNRTTGAKAQPIDLQQSASPKPAAKQFTIKIGAKQYRYNGSGDTSDLKNYTPLP